MKGASFGSVLPATLIACAIGCGSPGGDETPMDGSRADGAPTADAARDDGNSIDGTGDTAPDAGSDGASTVPEEAGQDTSRVIDAIADVTGDVAGACSAFAAAYCSRYEACAPPRFHVAFDNMETCKARTARFCPNEFGALGTAITSGSLAACAQAVSTLSCADWLLDPLPPPTCGWRGTLPNAAACEYSSQCESGLCIRPQLDSWCGVCQAKFKLGEICDRRQRSCDTGLSCADTCLPDDGGTCTQGRAYRCVVPQPEGRPCESINVCNRGLICLAGTCAKPKQVGEPCGALDCDVTKDLSCLPSPNPQGGICTQITYAAPGQTCNSTAAVICSAAGSCVNNDVPASMGTCRGPATDGAPCGPAISCVAPAICSGGTCQEPLPAAVCG